MKEDWTYKKLGEIAKIKSGKSIEANKILPYDDSLYPCYGGNGIRGYVEIFSNEGDIPIIGRVGALCGNVHLAHGKLYATEHALVVDITNPDIDANWLSSCLQSLNLRSIAKGVAQPVISAGEVSKICISIPSLKEQQQIVSELDLLSDVIKKQKTQIDELDKLAQSIFYDMFGDPVTNDKNWEKTELGKTCIYITDGDHMPPPKANCGIPFITISDIDKVHREIIFDDTFFVPIDYYNSLKEERKAKNGDVLYTVTGSYGIPVVINSDKEFCFQRHIALLRPDKEKLNTSFLCYWVLCDSVKHMADDVATGIAQKTVGLSSLRKFSIILPPLALQQEFAAKIEAIEQMKAKVRQSLKETEELFNSRMDYYFN